MLHTDWEADEPRKVTWLELFYDLVYVAAVIQLGDLLSDDVSWSGFWTFSVLFFLLWWSWTGTTAYFNRFLTDDALHRVLVVVQMFAVANIAINAPLIFEDGAAAGSVEGVAAAFVVVRLVLVALLVRAHHHCPDAREALRSFIGWSCAGIVVFAVAPFVGEGPRPWVWLLGVAVSMWGAVSKGWMRFERAVPADDEHLGERYALFTMIVLGESFVKTVGGLADAGADAEDEMLGGLGFAVVVALWWLYFDRIADRELPGRFWAKQRWIYLHLPLMLGITAVGVGTKKMALSPIGEPTELAYAVLFGGATALAVLAIAGVRGVLGDRVAAVRTAGVAAALVVVTLALGTRLPVGLFDGLVVALAALPVVLERGSPTGDGPELPAPTT